MLNIVSMDRAGLNNGDLKVKFEFEFNEDSALPEKSCSVGQKTYLIANGSTAKNITTNKSYEYKDGKWIKVANTSENETTTKSNKITDNGDYNIPNNDSTGFNDVSVNVAGVGLPKIATPIAYNENARYVLQGLYSGSTSVMISNTYSTERLSTVHSLYYVILQPISSIYFEYEFQGNKSGTIIFTALSNAINIKCYYGSQMTDVTYRTNSPIKKGDFKEGKTYSVSYTTTSKGSSTQYDTLVSVTEYDEPITFTLE